MFNIITLILLCFAEVFILHRIMQNLLGCPLKSRRLLFVLAAAYTVLSVTQMNVIYIPQLNTVCAFLFSVMVCCAYTGAWSSRILAGLIGLSIGTAGEGVVWLCVRMISDLSGVNISPDLWYFPLTTCAAGIMKLGIIFLFERIFVYFKKHAQILYTGITALVAILMVAILMMLVTFGDTAYLPAALVLVSMLLVGLIFAISLFRDQMQVQQERLRLDFLEQQSADQLTHYNALYQQMQTVHTVRHDMKNILINADSYLAMGDPEGARAYIREFQSQITPDDVIDTAQPLIDAVLTAKKAIFSGEFRYHIDQIRCKHIPQSDISMLLALALDNAVEGCAGCEKPYISVSLRQQGQILSLTVKNPTKNTPVDRSGLPRSSKPDADKHGYGLRSCKRLAEKWSGELIWACEDGVFALNILL